MQRRQHQAHWQRLAQRGAMALVVMFGAVLALVAGAGAAQAHAAYKSSNPAANSVEKVAPTSVSITFVQRLSPQGLSIVVYDRTGKVVSTSQAQISASDPYTASVSMAGDGSDIYRVDWNNVSAEDNDATIGAFVFGVDPSGATDKVPPVAAATPPPSTSTGVPPFVAALIGVAGLIVGAAFMFASLRPRMNR
ncbi:MAG TPA: copper resistance protein CopC [Ktedonobacterales bacterium]